MQGFPGQVRLFAKNLDTGVSFGLGEDELVRTASTIKLPVMVEGAGILFEFAPGLRLTLQDAVGLVIVISDNTAANLAIDRLGANAVNARMDALGLTRTRLMRKVMGRGDSRAGLDPANKRFGLGVSTPREMVTLLEKLEKGEVVSKEASAEMIAILKRQQHHDGIGRTLVGENPGLLVLSRLSLALLDGLAAAR